VRLDHATVQVLIALGLLNRRTVKPALLASFAWGHGSVGER